MEILNTILFWLGVSVFLYIPYIEIFCKGVPHYRTAPIIRDEIIKRLQQDIKKHETSSPYQIVDMGAGFGFMAMALAKAYPQAQVVGIEIDRIACWSARLIAWLRGIQNVRFIRGNAMAYDMGDTDAVTIYMGKKFMSAISVKLADELQQGALVFSNSYKLEAPWVLLEKVTIETKYPHQGWLYVYKKQ
ncbi:MAG: hypothetical protein CMH30_07360 [Micavibrio sp.]|nr:hypothetical protein [Micavibrio sp.]